MKSILILEDQYTPELYKTLRMLLPDVYFPVVENIKDPMQYCDVAKNVDVILLDNYFPWRTGGREEPLWGDFMQYLMEQDITTPVVCISDYEKKLLDRYDIWQQANAQNRIYGFPWKNSDKIAQLVRDIL